MIIQKSNISSKAKLYLVPTPIGNFDDMTYRSVEVLNTVDMVFAEDTRVTKVLLSHFNITTPLMSYHIFNEQSQVDEIIKYLQEEKNVALVSDAGLPGISDPGYLITKRAIDLGFDVVALPGANAALTALIASGIPSDKFFFYGFLKHKLSQKEKELEDLVDYPESIIFYESPHRIKETLIAINMVFGNRDVVVARELTKKFEEYIRGKIQEIIDADLELKGEIVIIVKGAEIKKQVAQLNSMTISDHYQYYLNQEYDSKEAMKMVAKDRGCSKSIIYKELQQND